MVVLALAVLALVKASEPSAAPPVHHTPHPASAQGLVDSLTLENVPAERQALAREVAGWKAGHPGGSCTIRSSTSADCTAADGLSTDLLAVAVTSTAP